MDVWKFKAGERVRLLTHKEIRQEFERSIEGWFDSHHGVNSTEDQEIQDLISDTMDDLEENLVHLMEKLNEDLPANKDFSKS